MANLACDVLVIGGGATGVCAAYDLARRGLQVILADRNDLSTGTSGRFHGLLHSGGRYAVRDPESARECIAENRILRRIAPGIVEDTGGVFVAAPQDPPDYADQWVTACAAAGIETEEIAIPTLRRREPALRPDLVRAFRVPDGSVDGFDLGHAFSRAAESYGARFLLYHRVTALAYTTDGMRATLNSADGTAVVVEARWVLNAGGPWAGEIAALAGHDLRVRWSRGVMIAMNIRWVNTVVNRLRPPDDGDILVPVGTVSVIGTTSVAASSPDDNTIEPWEVSKMLDEGEALIAGFRTARALRAWSGVRPLYEPPGAAEEGADGRGLKRTFSVVRHGPGFTSVLGGKLTTARLMAEKAADDVCAGLGVDAPCTTAAEPLPAGTERRYHTLGHRLALLESGKMPGALICECEMITRPQLEEAIAAYDHVPALDDLRRDLRLGMGPCQGGFCAVRAAGILRQARDLPASEAVEALRVFVAERFKGGRPLLWGQHLRQFLLDEMIYRRILGLDACGDSRPAASLSLPPWATGETPIPAAAGQRVVVIGAGLAGLAAAVHAVQAGARVRVLAAGLGRLILTPGWFALGPFAAHPGVEAFRRWAAGQDLIRLAEGGRLPSLLGIPRTVDLAPEGLAAGAIDGAAPVLIVGFAGWRDFDAALCSGMLAAAGVSCRAASIDLPPRHEGWDLSPTELAHRFDDPAFRAEVAQRVRARLNGEARVGFPAVLGLHDPRVRAEMAARIGVPVFEVPTLTPSVPGTRLYNTLKRWLLRQGAQVQVGHPVTRLIVEGGRATGVAVASAGRETIFPGNAFILATGGLYGGGLLSDDRGHVWEPIAGLAVMAGDDRTAWFRDTLLDPEGHPVHTFGLRVDEALRPLNETGHPVCANLTVAGHALGGFSPLAGGYDEGLDLASAYAAVRAALQA